MSTKYWFPTFAGKIIDIENPTPDMIDVEDIAQALSMTCRYGGHCRDYYSVAEHSLGVEALGYYSTSQTPDYSVRALALLLHDSAEAYLGDVVSPLKRLLGHPYADLEHRWLRAIEEKFDLGSALTNPDPLVKTCDLAILPVEIVNLCSPPHPDWWLKIDPPTVGQLSEHSIECLSPSAARRRFLNRFRHLQWARGPSYRETWSGERSESGGAK